jgi:predicted lipoprotein with Yx(FWY)xxD motif
MLAILTAGCQQANDVVEEDATTESPPASPSPDSQATVAIVDSSLGQILAGSDGKTVYVFMSDAEGESTCYDQCEERWPPVTITGTPEAGADINAELLSTTNRRDGSIQVTYKGRPLYHFSGDASPGETKGQGVGGVWFVVSADGEPIQS